MAKQEATNRTEQKEAFHDYLTVERKNSRWLYRNTRQLNISRTETLTDFPPIGAWPRSGRPRQRPPHLSSRSGHSKQRHHMPSINARNRSQLWDTKEQTKINFLRRPATLSLLPRSKNQIFATKQAITDEPLRQSGVTHSRRDGGRQKTTRNLPRVVKTTNSLPKSGNEQNNPWRNGQERSRKKTMTEKEGGHQPNKEWMWWTR